MDTPTISDAEYDKLFDELSALEIETGCVMSGSPTNRVGYDVVSGLEKVSHPIPLLSMNRTKSVEELHRFIGKQPSMLMMKLDGLTVRLDYEDGRLVLGATRGNGDEGEVVTHNISAFKNVPMVIPYKGKLSVSGEALIHLDDFKEINAGIDEDDDEFSTARNLAAGSVRCYDTSVCAQRQIYFYAFKVLQGFDDIVRHPDSKSEKLEALNEQGFQVCPYFFIEPGIEEEKLENRIEIIRKIAHSKYFPIDGLVATYDSISYSRKCGRTGHHYNDSKALKFEDEKFETVLRRVEWNPTRTGYIAPVAIFDTVEIDGCNVSRATLHNLSFIKQLELNIGCRIKISKRNMIIPHIEENLDRDRGTLSFPTVCPCCGKPIEIQSKTNDKGEIIETLYCNNSDCVASKVKKFTRFVGKKALNIEGLSDATLEKFIRRGFLSSFADLFYLDRYQYEIEEMEGFGAKTFANLWEAIQKRKSISFDRFLVCMDIPMVGSTASKKISQQFKGDIEAFENAIADPLSPFDFTTLRDIGPTIHNKIYQWFSNVANTDTWLALKKVIAVPKPEPESKSEAESATSIAGKRIAVTGTVAGYTRREMECIIEAHGGIFSSSVTRATDMLVIADKAGGTKLKKAREYRITTISAEEFLEMIE